MKFRFANENDAALILEFIRALAEYENMADEVVATEELLREWLFEKKAAEVIFVMDEGDAEGGDGIADGGTGGDGDKGGKEAGFALFFHNFSTFLGRPGLYLEDLFVLPEYRGKGYGKELLTRLAQIAVERGYGRFEWWCLDWNEPSIEFYRSQGAVAMDEWTVYRISGETLEEMGTPAK